MKAINISKKNLVLLIVIILIFVAVLYCFLSDSYVMPKGYVLADDIWNEKGFVRTFEADGTKEKPYDLIVWGSDPEGIAAAVAAARNGLHTLLIDYRDQVGGLFTLGRLNFIDMNYDDKNKLVTRGIFEEFYHKAGGVIFEVDKGLEVFEKMLYSEKLLSVRLGSELLKPIIADKEVMGIKIKSENGAEEEIYGKLFIDASQDADFAYSAGVPFTKGFEDIGLPGKMQAATLVFTVEGVNWYRVMWETLFVDRRNTSKATFNAAWGYDNYIREYVPESERIHFRGFNMAKEANGNVLINGLLVYGVDGTEKESRLEGKELAKKEAYRFMDFANKNLPGFEEAKVVDFAPELYVRHTRHMQGLYRITLEDVLENRDHWDRIAYGGYPVDIQAIDQHFPGIAIGEPSKYAVPFRSLVPPNVTNLLVVGRSFSSDSLAHGSTRIVPIGMSAAQAAGVAATYALAAQMNFHEIAHSEDALEFIRYVLDLQGAFVTASECEPPEITEHEYYEAMNKLRSLGIVTGGYKNDYKLDQPLANQSFLNFIFHGSIRSLNLVGRSDLASQMYYVIYQDGEEVTTENIEELFSKFFNFNRHLLVEFQEEIDLFMESISFTGGDAKVYSRGELYRIICDYISIFRS